MRKVSKILLAVILAVGMLALPARITRAAEGYVEINSEGFEGLGTYELPAGWSQEDHDGDGYGWYVLNDTETGYDMAHSGSCSIHSASYMGGALSPDNWLYTPEWEIGENYYLNFFYASQDEDWPDPLEVYVVTESGAASLVSYSEAPAEWAEAIISLEDYAGQTVKIAFVHHNVSDMFRIKLDDVKLLLLDPDAVFHTVHFELNGHGQAIDDQMVLEGMKANEPDAPQESGWTFKGWYTEEALENLYDFNTPVTEDLTLYAKWLEGDHAIEGYKPVLIESFESGEGTTFPEGWTTEDRDGDGENWFITNTLNPHHGTNVAVSASYINENYGTGTSVNAVSRDIIKEAGDINGALDPDNWLISPEIEIGTDYLATFAVKSQDPSWTDSLELYAIDENGSETILWQQAGIPGEVYTEVTVDLSEYESQTIKLAFAHRLCPDEFEIVLDCVYVWAPEKEEEPEPVLHSLTVDFQGIGGENQTAEFEEGTGILDDVWEMISEPQAEGYKFIGIAPEASYTTAEELNEGINSLSTALLEEDTTVYVIWFKHVDELTLSAVQPQAGTEAAAPEVTLNGEGVVLADPTAALWVYDEVSEDEFTGTFEEGKDYTIKTFIETEFGYYLDEETVVNVEQPYEYVSQYFIPQSELLDGINTGMRVFIRTQPLPVEEEDAPPTGVEGINTALMTGLALAAAAALIFLSRIRRTQ